MKKASLSVFILALLAALGVTLYGIIDSNQQSIDQIAGILALPDGQSVVAQYDDDRIEVDRVLPDGRSTGSVSIPRKKGGSFLSVTDLSADPSGNLYVLLDVQDAMTGDRQYQLLETYNLDGFFSKKVQSQELDTQGAYRYRWVDASSQVVLMATDKDEETIYREAFDAQTLLTGGGLASKGDRTYHIGNKDGVADVLIAGSNVVYRSRSGKVFYTAESQLIPTELYSAVRLQENSYPIFIAPGTSDTILMGVQESGDILSLSLKDGSTNVVKGGREPFSGISSYKPIDVMGMSMRDPLNFTAAVRGAEGFNLVVSSGGETTVVSHITDTPAGCLTKGLLHFLGWAVIFALIGQLLVGFWFMMTGSRTILLKLLFSSIPLLVLSLIFFGVFSFRNYSASVEQSFEKQVADEGSLLRALFGTESFEEIEYPYQYGNESYEYLRKNMETRTIYTATAYYERQSLYMGVSEEYPCSYPFDIRMDSKAADLYLEAAYSGQPKSGVINDASGERLVCITPIGGASGNVVYLLETGILMKNIQQHTDLYLRNYVLVSLAFVIVIAAILMLVFRRILTPIQEIKSGLEEFAQGDRSVRLTDTASDEFSDIVRVFNKMANDIDAQIYSLQQASETYFRFIPQQMLQLLGKENLGDVELGSSMEQDCSVLSVSLGMKSDNLTRDEAQMLTNKFFNILNLSCDQNGAILMADSASLRRIRILCPAGANSAVDLALSAISRLDAFNATLPVQNRLDPLFVVHRAPSYYGICGDENRLVPALISSEMDQIADCEKPLREFSSRLIVTETAYGEVSHENYFCRYIGHLEDSGADQIGLYDFYDAASPKETRLINETRSTFDKAIALYEEGRYYDAKGLFALVLRQNQYDNVARHYVFRAEKKL